ncbi:MAG TPA: hypothetical protein VF791_15425 [Pyrinomonadaceae bacterium]
MNRPALLLVILLAFTLAGSSQTLDQEPRVNSTDAERQQLISELQVLDAQAARLTSPLARARAKAEIASALWYLDTEGAKRMLADAYKLTLPDETEQQKSRAQAIGADLSFPTELERARREVRSRVLQIAERDHIYAKQLVKLGTESLGKNEANYINATLAREALSKGDTEAASKYLADAIAAEPTQTMAGLLIQELAKKDRAAADALIIRYIDQLRNIPFSFTQGTVRVYFVLMRLIFPTLLQDQQVKPPGPAVMKAYATYVVQSLLPLRQSNPSSLVRLRGIILTAGQPVRQYAPELMPAYLELESLSRSGNEGSPFQTPEELAESNRRDRERQLNASLNQETPDVSLIDVAARRGMFDKARNALKTLPDGDRKTQLTDFVDAQEAISLIIKGDVLRAERLAEKLRAAPQILEVYLSLINKCGKDQPCKNPLIYKALNQIKDAADLPPLPPANAPTELISTKREVDPKLSALNKLAVVAASADDYLMQAVFDEMIRAVNRTSVDSDLGKLGFDVDLFRTIARRDENRAQQLAVGITNPLRQVAALSATYEWRASELKKKEDERRAMEKKSQ